MSFRRLTAVAAVPLLLVAGFSYLVLRDAPGPERDGSVAILLPGPVEFFHLQRTAMDLRADELNLELRYFDAGWDAARQVQQVRASVELGVDAIGLASVDTDAARNAVDVAQSAGIPLMTFTNSVGDDPTGAFDGVTAHVGRDEVLAGRLLGEQIERLGLDSPRIVVLEGSPGTSPQRFRRAGFEQIAARNPDWDIAKMIPVPGWDLDEVETLLAPVIGRTEVNVIAVQWSQAGVVAAEVFGDRAGSQVAIVSLEWTEALVEQLERGTIRSSTWFSIADEGAAAIDVLKDIIDGTQVGTFHEVPQVIVDAGDHGAFPTEW